MNTPRHWAVVGSLLCVAGVWGLVTSHRIPSANHEPKMLSDAPQDISPIRDEPVEELASVAKPFFPDSSGTKRVSNGIVDPRVQPVIHQAAVAAAVVPAALGQMVSPTDMQIGYVDKSGAAKIEPLPQNDPIRSQNAKVSITGSMPPPFDLAQHVVALHVDGQLRIVVPTEANRRFLVSTDLRDGQHALRVFAVNRTDTSNPVVGLLPIAVNVAVKTSRVQVLDVDAESFVFVRAPYRLRVTFDTAELDSTK